jgi:hypothetical protein
MSVLAAQPDYRADARVNHAGGRATGRMLTIVAASAIVLAAVAFGLIRQPCNDIGWHLATGRVAADTGHWPVTNTFSHTHPNYPLDQQYPLFQTLIYGAYQLGGWSGLSFFNALGWMTAFLLVVRWGGSWRGAIGLHLPWMVALLAIQRRMIVRPDLLSVLFLACELLVIDRYLRRFRLAVVGSAHPTGCDNATTDCGGLTTGCGDAAGGGAGRSWAWLWMGLVPLMHWAWANAHQLFPLSLGVQGLLLVHLWLARWGRWGVDRRDRHAPVWPVVLAIAGSLGVSLLTPLGTGIVRVVANTSGSLAHHRADVQEFAYLWDRPWDLQIAVVCGLMGVAGLWRTRRAWRPLEVGLWAATGLIVLGAVRGLVFFGPISVALLARSSSPSANPHTTGWLRWPALRVTTAAATLLLAGKALDQRWLRPAPVLGGTQAGLGRSRGDWPASAVAFLRTHPPPGRMLNLPWSLGSPLIWELPDQPVFVDARLEAYPRAFLVRCMAAEQDQQVLGELITEYDATWIVANHRDPAVRARITALYQTGDWTCVHADTLTVILVRDDPDTRAYRERHALTDLPERPADLVVGSESLQSLQMAHYARLRAALTPADSR